MRVVEVALAELARRQVDRQRHRRCPRLQVGAGAPQDPLADRHDQPGLFQHRNEFDRRHDAAIAPMPAQQRLRGARQAAVQVDLGLIDERELLALEGAAQLAAELGAGRGCAASARW
jgi:hypothetical protein